MIGENALTEILKEQFINFLNSIEKYGLTHDSKMNIYNAMLNGLNGKIVDESIEYGRKLEREHSINNGMITQNFVNNNESQSIQFTANDESIIEKYKNHFLENGIDSELVFVFPLTEKEKALISEAKKRALKLQENNRTK